MENFENTNITTEEHIENVTEVITDPLKDCIFCGQKINCDMMFCSFCGKHQQKIQEENKETKKKFKRKIRKQKTMKNGIVFLILAYMFFGFSFICMITGIYRMNYMNITTISLFGSNSDSLIINQTHVVGNLVLSLIYLITGIFFMALRFLKIAYHNLFGKNK